MVSVWPQWWQVVKSPQGKICNLVAWYGGANSKLGNHNELELLGSHLCLSVYTDHCNVHTQWTTCLAPFQYGDCFSGIGILTHWPLGDFNKVLVEWVKFILAIDGWDISHEISSRWMSLDLTDDKSTLVQVMAWCREATSHYLSQCWPRSLLPLRQPPGYKTWLQICIVNTCQQAQSWSRVSFASWGLFY